MTNRDTLIQKRANEIFARENDNPELTLDLNFVAVKAGRKTKGAMDENDRQKIYHRAEQELIKEGAILDEKKVGKQLQDLAQGPSIEERLKAAMKQAAKKGKHLMPWPSNDPERPKANKHWLLDVATMSPALKDNPEMFYLDEIEEILETLPDKPPRK